MAILRKDQKFIVIRLFARGVHLHGAGRKTLEAETKTCKRCSRRSISRVMKAYRHDVLLRTYGCLHETEREAKQIRVVTKAQQMRGGAVCNRVAAGERS